MGGKITEDLFFAAGILSRTAAVAYSKGLGKAHKKHIFI